MASTRIDAATPSDAPQAAALAEAKRKEYAAYSPVFWRVAVNAAQVHEPWLAMCIGDRDAFTSFAARSGERLHGIVIAAHTVFPPPFRFDAESSWLVDDFFVVTSDDWATVGSELVNAVEDAARGKGAERVIVLSARKDEPKRTMLHDQGYDRGASWWVHPVTPKSSDLPDLGSTEAVTGPAPPVYDPGGITALALRLPDPADVQAFDDWAAASGTVLAIVPARATEPELEHALREADFEPASDWFVKRL